MIVEFDSDVEITEDLWNREDAVGEDGGGVLPDTFAVRSLNQEA